MMITTQFIQKSMKFFDMVTVSVLATKSRAAAPALLSPTRRMLAVVASLRVVLIQN